MSLFLSEFGRTLTSENSKMKYLNQHFALQSHLTMKVVVLLTLTVLWTNLILPSRRYLTSLLPWPRLRFISMRTDCGLTTIQESPALHASCKKSHAKAADYWQSKVTLLEGNHREMCKMMSTLLGKTASKTEPTFTAIDFHNSIDKKIVTSEQLPNRWQLWLSRIIIHRTSITLDPMM